MDGVLHVTNEAVSAAICRDVFKRAANPDDIMAVDKGKLIDRILMAGGVLTGFRKQEDGRFYLVNDGMDGGYRLSYADTDYVRHINEELCGLDYNFTEHPQVRISNLGFNGSVFDHVENGERANCMVLANLYWNPDRNSSRNARKQQDPRNFDGRKWREAFDLSGSSVLALIHSQCSGGNYRSRDVPDMIAKEASLKMIHQSSFTRFSRVSGKNIQLESAFFIR